MKYLKKLFSRSRTKLSTSDQEWLENTQLSKPDAVAIMHPKWMGIKSSTKNLLPWHREIDDNVTEESAQSISELLLETDCKRFVFSGGVISHNLIIKALKKRKRKVKCFILWHGSFIQSSEQYNWRAFKQVKELYEEGLIFKWGFVKKGMAEVVQKLNINTGFVMNFVDKIPKKASKPLEGGPHIGIWSLGNVPRKLPFAMLAACKMIENSELHCSSASDRINEFVSLMRIKATTISDPIPQELMPSTLSNMHLNLSVTLSECAPMLPLESLSVGTPCLLGPTSHYFEDSDFLHKTLVVPYPDSAKVISEYIQNALENREEIIQSYTSYAPGYNERAKATLKSFLEV